MDRCSAFVFDGWHRHRCQRRGKYQHEEKAYCAQHHPKNAEKRRRAKIARGNERWRRRKLEIYGPEAIQLLRQGFEQGAWDHSSNYGQNVAQLLEKIDAS